jgi:hypothetical protein
MVISAFALMTVTIINGEKYEAIPAVYDSYKECRIAEDKITKNYYETSCFYSTAIKVNKSSK